MLRYGSTVYRVAGIRDIANSPTVKQQRNKEMVDFMTEFYFSGDKTIGNKMRQK